MFLICEIFIKDATRWWFRAITVLIFCETLLGCLIISVGCSPSHLLEGKDNNTCSANVRHSSIQAMSLIIPTITLGPTIDGVVLETRLITS